MNLVGRFFLIFYIWVEVLGCDPKLLGRSLIFNFIIIITNNYIDQHLLINSIGKKLNGRRVLSP